MAIFKRKEIPEEEDEIIEKELKENKKFGKNFKDLKPANKKKRKEPPKPWGKKERYIVLAVLVITIIFAALLATNSQNSVRLSFDKPTFTFDMSKLNPFKERVIIIEKK